MVSAAKIKKKQKTRINSEVFCIFAKENYKLLANLFNKMKKQTIIFIVCMILISSCQQESIEKRAAREAKEFTEKNCPTPPQNNSILDSIIFDETSRTLTRYFTMVGSADNADAYIGRNSEFHQVLVDDVKNNTNIYAYKEAGFTFAFVYRSQKEKDRILYQDRITANDYQ